MPVEWLWIGSRDGVERESAARANIPFRAIHTGKFRRYWDRQTFEDAVRVPVGVVQAWLIVRDFAPDVVFSTGGFVSVPTVFAARRRARVPRTSRRRSSVWPRRSTCDPHTFSP